MDTELFQFLTNDLPVIAVLAYVWIQERANRTRDIEYYRERIQYHQRKEIKLMQVAISIAQKQPASVDLDDDTDIELPATPSRVT